MTQPDLFSTFSRSGDSIVPPTAEEIARVKRDTGISRAAEHANRASPDWLDRALGYVRLYALIHQEFMTEDARLMAENDGFTAPPTKKAWGAVMLKAAREGIVVRAGYAPASSSNGSPKCLWRSLVLA